MGQSEPKVGRLVGGKYRLGQVLAVGGMGLVYDATHDSTGRAVAVKLLRSELLAQPDIVRRVSAEARLAVQASHPNVVEVLDAGADEGVPYLVLERLYGMTLEAISAAPLSLAATVQAVVPVANAVATLHRLSIVHRDIKPSNIFLHREVDGRLTPKLLDFGIAKAVASGSATWTGGALGTPAYMAPERALGHHLGGPPADVWSMAVVFIRCVTGRLPFANARSESAMSLRAALDAEPWPEVPEPVAAVIRQALAFEPGERPANMEVFRDQLLRALVRLEPERVWPSASTVSYAPSETDLARAIASAPRSQEDPQAARGRPRHVETRTMTQGARELHGGRRSLAARVVAAPLVIFALAAAAFALRQRTQEQEATVVPAPEAPVMAHGSEPMLPAPALAVETSGPEPLGVHASEAVVPPREATAPVPMRSGLPAARRATPAARSPADTAVAARSASVRLGANRAPIIE